jgi:hypothetical protein
MQGGGVMSTDDELFDAAIEPVIASLQHFVRCHRAVFPDELSINRERFLACWIAGILSDVGVDLERAVQSLHEDGLDLHDDPLLEINGHAPIRDL